MRNIIPNTSILLVVSIIIVSQIPTYLKVIMAIFAITFLFPTARKIMFKNKLRKIRVAFYTALIFSLGLIALSVLKELPSFDGSIILVFLFILFFSSIGIFCFGIPASIIAELVSNRFRKYRVWLSGAIHIGFGLFTSIFGFFDGIDAEIFILSTICSVIYFVMDEITKKKLND